MCWFFLKQKIQRKNSRQKIYKDLVCQSSILRASVGVDEENKVLKVYFALFHIDSFECIQNRVYPAMLLGGNESIILNHLKYSSTQLLERCWFLKTSFSEEPLSETNIHSKYIELGHIHPL